MENNIELFDSYIDNKLSPEEKTAFDSRLKSDRQFLADFRIYLFTLDGLCREVEQDNAEFGIAMKKLSKDDLLRIIGRSGKRKNFRFNALRERMAWAASVAALIIIGAFSVFRVQEAGNERLDNTLVAYNYVPGPSRDGEPSVDITVITATELEAYLPQLKKTYEDAPSDDMQAGEYAGMRLAMAYLQLHDRSKAKSILEELKERFADDEEFAAQCNRILAQLK